MAVSPSNTADLFSQLFNTFTTLAVLVGVVVFALMAFLVVKYRAKGVEPDPEDAPRLGKVAEVRGHARTAIISVGLSSIILGVLIFGTLVVTNQINSIPARCLPPPGECLYVRVTGFRFGWSFTYISGPLNGTSSTGNLVVPAGTTVVLEISSKDVFHSFGIDDFRVKKDAFPGLVNKIWFVANLSPGVQKEVHVARCFEVCGSQHTFMTASVSVCSNSGC